MSTTAISPIFKLNFEQTGDTMADITGNGFSAKVNSATGCTPLTNDPLMGNCLQFNGTSDANCTIAQNLTGTGLTDLSNGLTMCAWVNFTKYTFSSNLLQLGAGADTVAFTIGSGTPVYVNAGKPQGNMLPKVAAIGQWHHVAITVDSNGELIFYMDGVALKPVINPVEKLAEGFKTTSIQIGGKDFEAMLAWLSVYNGPLGLSEILEDMAEGKAGRTSSFRKIVPIDFKLYSDDGGAESPIMFIKDAGAGEDLNLRIQVNKNQKPLSIEPRSGTAGDDNYHFQLRFRPGTLTEHFVATNTPQLTIPSEAWPGSPTADEWSASVARDDQSGEDMISFLYTGKQSSPAPITLAPGDEGKIVVQSVNASATQGSRNTNVELRYSHLYPGSAKTGISGQRTQNISIVNHSGEKEIPLKAEVVGNASVMTYARELGGSVVENPPSSELLFRIVNTGSKPLPLAIPGAKEGPTTFTLTIDVQPTGHLKEWALIDQADISSIHLDINKLGVVREYNSAQNAITLEGPLIESLAANTSLQIGANNIDVVTKGAVAGTYVIPLTATASGILAGDDIQLKDQSSNWQHQQTLPAKEPSQKTELLVNNMQWTITNQSIEELASGGGFSFLLKDINCSLPAGTSTVTLAYKNIPGHWQGAFEIPVERSPLAFNQNLIGINTQKPEASLHIKEEPDFVPFKTSVKKPGNLEVAFECTADYGLFRSMQPISNSSEGMLVFDPMLGGGGLGYSVTTYSVKSGAIQSASVDLPTLSGHTNPGSGTAIYSKGALFVLGNNGEQTAGFLNTYVFDGTNAPTIATGFNVEHSGTNYPGKFLAIVNDCAFVVAGPLMTNQSTAVLQYSGVNSGSSSTAPKLAFESITSIEGIADVKSAGNGLYLLQKGTGTTTLLIWTVQQDGSLVKSQMSLTGTEWDNIVKIFKVEDKAVILTSDAEQPGVVFSLGILDVSDPDNVNVLQDATADPTGIQYKSFDIYKNLIISEESGWINIIDYKVPGYKIISRSVTDKKYKFILFADKLFAQYAQAGSADSKQSDVYIAKHFFEHYIGQNTMVSADNITISSTSQANNSYLQVPYPSSGDQCGLVIGNDSQSASSALSIAVEIGSQADPMTVQDGMGSPIFNIKQPGSEDDTYRIGIGTDNPKAALHVESQTASSITADFYAYNNVGNGPGQSWTKAQGANTAPISIRATGTIRADQFYAMSDVREKEMINQSDYLNDLSTLLKLKVSDYQYVDFIGKGAGQKKGLIAQELEEVFPQAVNAENTGFIPDIYAMASDIKWQQNREHLRIKLERAHDLKTGDTVRLIAEKGFEEKEVVAVPDDKTFIVAEWQRSVEKLFVFGKEVHDFHTVDYDQVAMLGVSAIQALHSEVASQKKENQAQKQRLADLEKEMEALKTERANDLAQIRKELMAFKTAVSKQHEN